MESDPYRGLEPARLWAHFAALNSIPRPSGHEAAARDYVLQIADEASAPALVDQRGNTFVRLPANGSGSSSTVAVQTHLDMVCDQQPGVVHDWKRDPISVRRDGDAISARGTTLGADNGIGVAIALTLIDAPAPRGPLELVFTVDEESGRWGALDVDASLLTAEALINLDSEDPDAITIGSAGGGEAEITLPFAGEPPARSLPGAELRVSGLRGGHSGLQIQEPHLNGIKLLGDALAGLRTAGVDFRLAEIAGGSARNAIPRGAVARLGIEAGKLEAAQAAVAALVGDSEAKLRAIEPRLEIELSEAPRPESVLAPAATDRLLELLRALPHGVVAQSARFAGVVETSANLALAETRADAVSLLTSVRSLSMGGLRGAQEEIRAVARSHGASCDLTDDYPVWEPRTESPLRDAAVAAYRRTYGKEPRIDVLHAGLECGAFLAKKPDLDAISIGPRIRDAHTPQEHVYASTVEATWRLLVSLLEELQGPSAGAARPAR